MGTKYRKIIRFAMVAGALGLLIPAFAQPFSYIYIQGDKSAPFYVKMEGKMLPRYGKTYCIIPELDSGTIHIEILFQQRMYPAQKFTIEVPEHGYRGFLLNRQGAVFTLYDLQQKKDIAGDGK